MPSSPESVLSPEPVVRTVHVWEPQELAQADRVREVASFEAIFAEGAPRADAPFEVSGAAAVPESVLRPARRAAEAAGYASGWARGLAQARSTAATRAAQERVRAEAELAGALQRVAGVVATLEQAVAQVRATRTQTVADVEDAVLDTAFAIVESLVGSVLTDDELRGRTALARALANRPDDGRPVTVHLHPADQAIVAGSGAVPADVTIIADPALAPGDVLVEGDSASIDAGLPDALARVREVLGR